MKIGLIDVDGFNYPNLPLMKISAYHKNNGDSVEWYQPLFSGHMDIVYLSKIFSFTQDYQYFIDADVIKKGGSGYAIENIDGREIYNQKLDKRLPDYIEHIYPDYSLYNITDTAYGFLTRGCPRNCSFCHVGKKEGFKSIKVANLSEFWHDQKYIVLHDPNILACKDYKELLNQLIDSKSYVDFNQGLDIRLMNFEKADLLSYIKTKELHFAWDRIEDKELIIPKFEMFRKVSKVNSHNLQVYVLCGDRYRDVIEDDLFRINWLKNNGYAPYVMLYDKENLPKYSNLKKLQRYVNNRYIFWKCNSFEEYLKNYI